eukprot:gene10022-11083_t
MVCGVYRSLDVHVISEKIVFENVSLGLNYDYLEVGRQCRVNNTLKHTEDKKALLTYTPNRKLPKEVVPAARRERSRLAIVLAVGGHSDSHYNYGPGGSINGLMAVWDSWMDNFFSVTSNTTSLILLFDERDFRRQNHTRSKELYLNNIVMSNMGGKPVDCLRMKGALSHKADACSNELYLDQGYRVYYIPTNDTSYQKPLIIFAGVHLFPPPFWVKSVEEEEELFKSWKPWRLNRRYPTNYGYVKMTNWYSYYMLKLQLLDFFDYGGKLDNDVSFAAPFPEPNLPLMMAEAESFMLVTQNNWYHDDPRISQGVHLCLKSYLTAELKHCNGLITQSNNKVAELVPSGISNPTFWETNFNTTFRAHFLVFWFGLYTAPQVKHLARFWNEFHPRGMWDFRWGDQQWWPRPIVMFGSGDLSKEIIHYDKINTDNGKFVVHKEWPRWGTIPLVNYYNVNGSSREERNERYRVASKKFIY